MRQTAHFTFRFAPSLPSEHFDAFARAHERAYENITSFFGGAPPPRAIQYFVWGEEEVQQTGWRPGFARPEFVLVHTRANQTVGHELTHVISHWAVHPTQKSGLINEGAAVYLDQSGTDVLKRAREELVRRGIRDLSIEQLWGNWGSLPEEVAYPVAGAFVQFMIEEQGKDRFLEIFHEQTLEHARAVYGPELDAVITRFEAALLQPPAA